jgi:phospholipid-binding lipoprotein MlaA
MTLLTLKRLLTSITFIASILLLSACSQTNSIPTNAKSASLDSNSDPYEKTNRRIFKFNAGLDIFLVKPVAKAYKTITPDIVDNGVSNFFNNLDDVGSAINSLLQFKPGPALMDTERVLFNSTVGLGGLFDVASTFGIERYEEDFGQTLAHWGVGSGPYVMLPFLGPSTVRDATAKLTVDRLTNPTSYHDESLAFTAFKLLDKRADLFNDEEAFKDISDDPYSALRDLWLQRRTSEIRDGKEDEQEQSDLIDELESLEDD